MARRLTPGLVVGVPTSRGVAYAQFVSHVRPNGALIRVLPGIYSETPDLAGLVARGEEFWAFLPLGTYISRGQVSVIGSYPIPPYARQFPLMRTPAGGMDSNRWWLWDGETEWQVERSDPRVRTASLKATYNLVAIVEDIEAGKTPASEFDRFDASSTS